MPKIILKPSNEKFDIQICIPAYKREYELEVLFQSIRNHLDDVDYNLYFLLNGANENVKKIVLEKLAIYNNTGVVIFEENIKDGVFTWPFFNLPQGLFWVLGDDDLLTERSREAIQKAIEYDLTILNYDLYDNQLKKKLKPNYLGSLMPSKNIEMDIKSVFSIFGDKLTFISSVIINSKILSLNFASSKPKSFQYASLIYNSISKSKRKASIFFEDEICLKQRGNNIPLKYRSVTDNIFINELRAFYISMIHNPLFRFAAIRKLIQATFIDTPRLLIRSKIEGRSANVKSFFFIDFVYFFVIKLFIIIIPVQFFKLLRGFFR